jgi:membrane associated rhomboid family serine protease
MSEPSTADLPPLFRPAPWNAPDLFPPRPDGEGEYGWRSRGRSHPCTRENLIERCRSAASGKQAVELVWTPDTPRLVPPAEIPWLVEPLRQRARDDLYYNLRVDVLVLAAVIAYVWYMTLRKVTISAVFLAIFFLCAVVPAVQDIRALSRLRRSTRFLADQAAALRYGVWLGSRRIVASYFVGGAMLAVWAAQVVVGGAYRSILNPDVGPAIETAGLVKSEFHRGQWWRLFTAEMLHGHWIHFVLNLLSLLAVGRLLEVHASWVYLSTVFLFSALTASLASVWLAPATTSVGASGAIMGLVGFLAVLGYRRRDVLPRVFLKSIVLSIGLTAAAGLVAYNVIDNAAHLGGLLGGVILGVVYVGRRSDEDEYRLTPSHSATVAGAVSAVLLVAVTFYTIWLIIQARLQAVTPTG